MSIGTFEDEVIATLKTNNDNTPNKDIHVSKYFGELSQPKSYIHPQDGNPNLLIDYIKEDPDKNSFMSNHTFNIYIAHISFSGNDKTRTKKHKDIYSLLSYIDSKLSFSSFVNSEPIRIDKTEKIFDNLSQQGYLTVYQKRFTCMLPNQEKETNE